MVEKLQLQCLASQKKVRRCTLCLNSVSSANLNSLTVDFKRMQTKKHRINRKPVIVEVYSSPISTETKHHDISTSEIPQPKTIVVSGLPEKADEELVKMYFEGKRAGGSEGCVEECSLLSPVKAQVKFYDSQGEDSHMLTSTYLLLKSF